MNEYKIDDENMDEYRINDKDMKKFKKKLKNELEGDEDDEDEFDLWGWGVVSEMLEDEYPEVCLKDWYELVKYGLKIKNEVEEHE